ncbi:MAG: nicotinate (nicotinamide) nucleotide adenylyltransferase [Chloroflexota bacterium]|nr:nicotinate (nicotinamide) nucleotide adenylyltransferase [Chloroflexota bacterium]
MSPGLIGLFGGTFDPAHSGHFAAAEAALKAYDFCRLVFIPAGDPYLKSDMVDSVISSSEHRVEMMRLALEHHGNPKFELSETETRREGPSYTLDTARLFAVENPQSEIVVILGMDTILSMPLWKDPDTLLSEFRVAAITRPGFDESKLSVLSFEGWASVIEVVVADTPDISSSQIRKTLAVSEAEIFPMDMLYPPVKKFIRDQDLYK